MPLIFRTVIFAAITVLAVPAFADNSALRKNRIFNAVSSVISLQRAEGEDGVIPMLKACYAQHARAGVGLTPSLEECIAKDIAYSNLSTGIYRQLATMAKRSPVGLQPNYSTIAVMRTRVYDAASLAGLVEPNQTNELKEIASISFKALTAAIEEPQVGSHDHDR